MSALASRRSFLRGFTALSAGSVVLAAPVVLAAAPSPDAVLLRLDTDLSEALRVYDGARAVLDRCRMAYEAAKPEIPEGIRLPLSSGWCHTEWPPGFNGAPSPSAVQNRIRIPCQYDLGVRVKAVDGRTVRGRELRRLKTGSDAYHAEHDAVLRRVGAQEADTSAFLNGRAVLDVGFAIMEIDATTKQGLAVKGRAGLAMHRVWGNEGTTRIEDSYRRLLENLASLDVREGGR